MLKSMLLPFALVLALEAAEFPAPATDISPKGQTATAVFAGGCFWGVEGVFDHVKGVKQAVSGYAGGAQSTANYETVETGRTGHAESVQVTYDPSQISFGKLLQVYFSVAHDPTELNRQGPDSGTQYRSAIFYADDEQKRVAEAYIQQLNTAGVFKKKIVTQITALPGFYPAEGYHQHFLEKNPSNPYIVYNDLPKLKQLKKQFPELWK
ncbi:MAG TPA: peptide-methionine (S)-S-oxide reductase MsrA [Bryobacteraceae bacterium]|nr:peptide-methionine (S)-S-oxide reductase MsrA [Bryobacteraceae bacterium]